MVFLVFNNSAEWRHNTTCKVKYYWFHITYLFDDYMVLDRHTHDTFTGITILF
jgi:hypothetical protein